MAGASGPKLDQDEVSLLNWIKYLNINHCS